tara:strand:- start:659 stop:1123 length:465 start_codon:yes stop_codon:yes gene_type:complete
MKTIRLFFLLLCFCFSHQAFAQHVFPDVVDNCYLDQFVYETDEILAKLDNEKIIEVVTASWDEKTKKNAEGILGFQVLVDNRGTSCLMSIRNETNIKTKKMNLVSSINDNLKWPRMQQKVSVIVVMEFKDGEITMKRMGTKDMKTLTEVGGEGN